MNELEIKIDIRDKSFTIEADECDFEGEYEVDSNNVLSIFDNGEEIAVVDFNDRYEIENLEFCEHKFCVFPEDIEDRGRCLVCGAMFDWELTTDICEIEDLVQEVKRKVPIAFYLSEDMRGSLIEEILKVESDLKKHRSKSKIEV